MNRHHQPIMNGNRPMLMNQQRQAYLNFMEQKRRAEMQHFAESQRRASERLPEGNVQK